MPDLSPGTPKEHASEWLDLQTALADNAFDALLPPHYRRGSAEAETALQSGHGGSDYYTTATFIAACRAQTDAERAQTEAIGIHEAMDMTLPGLCSQLSAERGVCVRARVRAGRRAVTVRACVRACVCVCVCVRACCLPACLPACLLVSLTVSLCVCLRWGLGRRP